MSGADKVSLADEKIRAMLERVAQDVSLVAYKHGHGAISEFERVLERRLLPLLLAGQAMRDSAWVNTQQRKDYDSALAIFAAAQGQPEKENGR